MKKIIILSLSIFAAFSGNLSAQCQSGQCYQGQGYQGQGYQGQGYQGQGYYSQSQDYQGQGRAAPAMYDQNRSMNDGKFNDGRLNDQGRAAPAMYDQNRSMNDGRHSDRLNDKLNDGKLKDGRFSDGRLNDGSSTMYDLNRSGVTGPRGVTGAMVSDAELTKLVQDAIGPGYFSKGYERVTVRANGGTIILQGFVEKQEDKQSLENTVRKIDGVRDINNQVIIQTAADVSAYGTDMYGSRGSTGATGLTGAIDDREFPQDKAATAEDSLINKRIRDQVSRGWLWDSYKEVTLDTKDGVVTLKGNVNREVDLQKLITEIQKINGVRSVQTNVNLK